MGEYATYKGQQVKIGTCEDMLYLRADQARLVTPESGNIDPIRDASRGIRFRFPFRWEDGQAPGTYENPFKRVSIPGLHAPDELRDEHYSVQFVAQQQGYVMSLPCPEGCGEHTPSPYGRETYVNGLRIHRNGFAGSVFLSQQRLVDGQLLPILECACGLKWRVPEDDSAYLFTALQAAAQSDRQREQQSHRHWNDGEDLPAGWTSMYEDMAGRIRQGYDRAYVASLGF
jgi:hypothetical protein